MASCDVQTLADSAACFDCLSPGEQDTVRLSLLASIAGKTAADIQTLLDSGAAFADLTEEEFRTLKLQMLCEWSTP